jgi:hypothetical protein
MAHSVTLTWQAPTSGSAVTQYDILRGLTAGAEVQIATVPVGTLTYVDSDPTLVEGKDYFYVVKAQNSAGDSGPSNEVSVIIPFLVPGAPIDLVAVAV